MLLINAIKENSVEPLFWTFEESPEEDIKQLWLKVRGNVPN